MQIAVTCSHTLIAGKHGVIDATGVVDDDIAGDERLAAEDGFVADHRIARDDGAVANAGLLNDMRRSRNQDPATNFGLIADQSAFKNPNPTNDFASPGKDGIITNRHPAFKKRMIPDAHHPADVRQVLFARLAAVAVAVQPRVIADGRASAEISRITDVGMTVNKRMLVEQCPAFDDGIPGTQKAGCGADCLARPRGAGSLRHAFLETAVPCDARNGIYGAKRQENDSARTGNLDR